MKRLGVNIDHVATLRNARGEFHPDPVLAAKFVKKKGADSITIHLREDRRHIKDLDAKKICSIKKLLVNLEISIKNEIVKNALKIKPDFIMTNIGGGTQEVLGLYLKKKIKFKTTILCTGGAISFFTGDQAPINNFFDKFYLGWLVRLVFNPLVFYKRYIFALKLFPMVLFSKVKFENE